MRILLVEDDESLASGLKLALGRACYTVEHVGDGVAAVAALEHNAFDLAILDLGLPCWCCRRAMRCATGSSRSTWAPTIT
jgi:DNA-binding response OmpR family regulator